MSQLTANDLKTKGVAAIEAVLADRQEFGQSFDDAEDDGFPVNQIHKLSIFLDRT